MHATSKRLMLELLQRYPGEKTFHENGRYHVAEYFKGTLSDFFNTHKFEIAVSSTYLYSNIFFIVGYMGIRCTILSFQN
jgi:hypothetical protein